MSRFVQTLEAAGLDQPGADRRAVNTNEDAVHDQALFAQTPA